jgi:site-specific recombinase XerD
MPSDKTTRRKPPANKGQRYPADVLSTEEVDRLLRAEPGRSSLALRNRALIATIYRGALRVGETVALRPSDVDLGTGRLHVRNGKGGKARVVGLDNGALAIIGEWTERRASLGFTGRQPLFCSLKGTAIRSPYLRRLLPRLAARAELGKRVHPHALRHSRAAELAGEGTPVNVIQSALGHSSLQTTAVYLEHIAPEQVLAAMQGNGWSFDGE